MTSEHTTTKRLSPRIKAIAICATLVFWASCTRIQIRQGWDDRLGPVVPHDSFPADCTLCHTGTDWNTLKPDFSFDHEAETGVALTGAHRDAQCLLCHNDRGPVAQFAAKGCAGCHVDIHLGHLGPACDSCHNDDTWKPRDAIARHNKTRFPLLGAHAAIECFMCHEGAESNVFLPLDTSCVSCHFDDYNRTRDPVHTEVGFGTSCDLCHSPIAWDGAITFSHPRTFPLSGGHGGLRCDDCHSGNSFGGLSTDCISCHASDFQSTTSPNHALAGFSTDCEDCHTTQGWTGAAFNHTPAFPLTQGHAGLDCSDCHIGGVYTGLSSDCVSCHFDDYQATTEPSHAASGFSTDCELCHTTRRWEGAQFNHPATFPLTQGHSGLDCEDCHIGGVYTGLSTDCVSCHLGDYQSTNDPNHAASGFPTDCEQCHNTSGWEGANFVHTASFPLSGGHGGLDCEDCHTGGVYTGLSTDCVTCHLGDYQAAANPNHGAAGFSTDCEDCHTINGWSGVNFNHTPSFPLTGGHGGLDCDDCHTGGVYNGLSTDCVSCHLADYQGTTDPNHATSGFGTNCEDCHTTVMWEGAAFSHPATFQLLGGHGGLTCDDCHVGGVYTGLSTSCVSCHLGDYQGASDPSHGAAHLSMTCENCHTINTWDPASYVHTNAFPLTGGHAGHNCNTCHGSNVYQGLPSDCVTCHIDDYNGTNAPNHAASGFSTDCEICHFSTATWQGAAFSHPGTFPLTQGHSGLDCTDCHVGGVYTGLSTACVSCHFDDYQGTKDPNHGAAGIGTLCQNCHTTATWDNGSYSHTNAFPLTGGHAGHNCNTCHGSNVYHGLPSSCVSCHLDDYNNTTDPDHQDVGFPTDCDQCHFSNVTWQGAVFNHDFPINNGPHSHLDCSDCHIVPGNSSVFSCIDCHEHRQTRMDQVHHEVNGYVWSSPACLACHPNGND
ncbi:MAG: hypothetical protein KDA16_04080 [Phycisphaerales bacterium]|nr:hypothetical protein [Phycisphaerales bacterium]